jgi:phosphate/sulfate permease
VSGWTKTLIFIVVAPLIGMTVGLLVMTAIYWMFATRAVARRSLVPALQLRLGRGVQPDARRQRRAEDDGHHHGRARDGRLI